MSAIELFGEPETGVDLENTDESVTTKSLRQCLLSSLCKDKEGSLET